MWCCVPVKLKAPALNAKDGQVAIEELQMVYETMQLHQLIGKRDLEQFRIELDFTAPWPMRP